MGNTLKKKLDACSCQSSCQIEKEVKDIRKLFNKLSLEELIKLKEYLEQNEQKKETIII